MPDQDTAEFRPAPERSRAFPWIITILLACAVAAGVAWWFWLRAAAPPAVAPPVAAAPEAPVAPPPLPEASGPQNPVDALAPPEAALPALAQSDARVAELLAELVGREKMLSFLLTDGFIRRVVATVDNLGRAQAPSRMWPVHPMPQRFVVDGGGNGPTPIAAANAARYNAFLAFAEAVPLEPAVALYARLYPLFQQAYEELGYPKRYFNDRLVAVLDDLLRTPEPTGPLMVKLTPVNTEVANLRPWVRYEFADPALEALPSGQKILLRMGPANEARAKALVRELRRRIATSELPPKQ
ncbi:DUF3014 domain-containing protein [Acidovorax sp.]|uniref:DUF3014 domain-containing protein n=1 Tax=Acidovorax sp. TaxID=1872122 RepID=UPI00260189D8|nr:DUF3014 domain-containing protein [Acidovorax sp.]